MSTVLWVKLGSKGSSRVPCEKKRFWHSGVCRKGLQLLALRGLGRQALNVDLMRSRGFEKAGLVFS